MYNLARPGTIEIIAGVNKELIPSKDPQDNLLTLIQRIAASPLLSQDTENVARLSRQSQEFLDWLDYEFVYDIYSANIAKNVSVNLSRRDVLYLAGNRCKHVLTRSNHIFEKLIKRYRASGLVVAPDEETSVLYDIDAWLFDDFCSYHFTKLCELCSNLYLAIVEYVRPEHNARRTFEGGRLAGYNVPASLTRFDNRSEFYELLHRATNVWRPVIQTPEWLTKKY